MTEPKPIKLVTTQPTPGRQPADWTARRFTRNRQVALENDAFRHVGCNSPYGKVLLSKRVREFTNPASIVMAVMHCEVFPEDLDPAGRHEIGSVTVGGEVWFFKFDYYGVDGCDPVTAYDDIVLRILNIYHESEI